MRYITADYIFPVSSPPIKNGTVVIDDDGMITDVFQSAIQNKKTEIYEGIIVPGFINAHCHLEISCMRNRIKEKTGLTGFISEFLKVRPHLKRQEIEEGISAGEEEMIA